MELGLETFSYHLAFRRGMMTTFDFIKRTAELGLAGVEINISEAGPDWGHLGSPDPGYLREVRALAEENGLYIEIDTHKTDPVHLRSALDLCSALGAKVLRTYEKPTGDLVHDMDQAVRNMREIVPVCADLGIQIAFENHEYETSSDIVDVIERVGSEWIGALVDTGNSMTVWEDPIQAVKTLAPYAVSTHFKDHVVFIEDDEQKVAGVTLGTGSIDCAECFRILRDESSISRVNIEVCYGYSAPFRREKPTDFQNDSPAFAVIPSPYDPSWIAPSTHLRSDMEDQNLPKWQDQSVVASVEYVKKIESTLSKRGSK
ncbi:MAG: sugar phosphate isomerase/epimerase [Spirochaetales bacterium]|jgi:3-oxoisoapionate decarboxylase|nr:sugar phosphate isomerase/epimerase [Spirochaetales bacterium]